MSSMNPLKLLGIEPTALRGLDIEQVEKFVSGVVRSWVQVEHPDVGGDEDHFKEIQDAASRLDDPEQLQHFLELHLRPTKTQLAEARRTVEEREGHIRGLIDQRNEYLLATAGAGETTVYHDADIELPLLDVIQNHHRGAQMSFKAPPFFTIEVKQGELTELRSGKRTKLNRKLLGVVHKPVNILELMAQSQPPTHTGRQIPGRRGEFVMHDTPQFGKRLGWKWALPIFEELSPHIKQDGYLFTSGLVDGERYLWLEGMITTQYKTADQ